MSHNYIPKIYFADGWHDPEQHNTFQYRWSKPVAYLSIDGFVSTENTKTILTFLNNNTVMHKMHVYLQTKDSEEFVPFTTSEIQPKEKITIHIPIYNIKNIKITSDIFKPDSDDTRSLGLMLVDMLVETEEGGRTKLFLSNSHNYRFHFIKNIKEYNVSEVNLYNTSNDLECICLLITGKELKTGLYAHFIDQVKKTIGTNNPNILKNIDFKILVKMDDHEEYYIDNFISFKSTEIIKIDIPKDYDVYLVKKEEREESQHLYGYFSGPNYAFFNTIFQLKKYNTTLFLECDCFLSDGWVDKIYNYTKCSGGFWISGALYDGNNTMPSDHLLNSHLNGGVCLYKTGDENFQKFMHLCLDLLPTYISYYTKDLPYDFFIKSIINYHFNYDLENRDIWQFIKRQYIFNNFINNYSTSNELLIPADSIFRLYNSAIIHKKPILPENNQSVDSDTIEPYDNEIAQQ